MTRKKEKLQKKKTQIVEVAAQTSQVYHQWWEWGLLGLIGLLVFYPPFFQGLYFQKSMFVMHVLTALVFILVWIVKTRNRDYCFIQTPLDWAVLAFAIAYGLSLISAVQIGSAVYGCLKAFNYFMLYWLVTQAVKEYRQYLFLCHVLLAAALGVAAIGILAASGHPVYPEAYIDGLIYSTLGYHNAAAAYMAAMSILGFSLLTRNNRWPWQLGYCLVVYLLLVITLSTISKGAWLILGVGGLLLLVGMPGIKRIKSLYYMGGLGIVSFLVGNKFLLAHTGSNPSKALWVVIGGALLAGLVWLGWEACLYLLQKTKRGPWILGLCLVVLLSGAGYVVASGQAGISGKVVKEFRELGQTDNSSYITRVDFNRWAMEIVKDYPIFGTGSGGWSVLHHRYQDYRYYTTEVHNHFAQVWVEAGTIGFLAFISMWLCLFCSLFFVYRVLKTGPPRKDAAEDQDHWILIWGTAATAVAMASHALIDFDLSIPALSLILWTLLALSNAGYRMANGPGYSLPARASLILACILGGLMLFLGTCFAIGARYNDAGGILVEQADQAGTTAKRMQILESAAKRYQKATAIDPLNGTYYANLAVVRSQQFRIARTGGDRNAAAYNQEALQAIQKAVELSPYDMDAQNRVVNAAKELGNLDLFMERIHAILEANPFDISAYESQAAALMSGAEYYMQSDKTRALEYMAETISIPKILEQQRQRTKAKADVWKGERLHPSAMISVNVGKAYYFQGQYTDAVSWMRQAYDLIQKESEPDRQLLVEVNACYAAVLERQGQSQKAGEIVSAGPDPMIKERFAQLTARQPVQ